MGNKIVIHMELNVVYNEDCLEGMNRIEDKSIDMILTDIPYDEVNRKSNGLRKLEKYNADILNFDLQCFLDECIRVCNGSFYIFCGIEQVSFIKKYLVENKLSVRHCVWEKTNPSPMNGQYIWLSSIENCIYGKKPKSVFNEHCKSSVWKFPCGKSKIHPTEKPLKLFEYLIKTSSNEGDIVLDTCMGSGTTAIACMNTNRNYIGFELDKGYYDIILERIKNHKPNVIQESKQGLETWF
jgi:DNA modification methylase